MLHLLDMELPILAVFLNWFVRHMIAHEVYSTDPLCSCYDRFLWNTWRGSTFLLSSQYFSNICLIVKIWFVVDICFKNHSDNLLKCFLLRVYFAPFGNCLICPKLLRLQITLQHFPNLFMMPIPIFLYPVLFCTGPFLDVFHILLDFISIIHCLARVIQSFLSA